MSLDWQNRESDHFLNPHFSRSTQIELVSWLKQGPSLPGHLFLLSSGTTLSQNHLPKWVAISKTALLVSAAAVNDLISARPKDLWINVLPQFHIGSLAILARAHVSQTPVNNDLAHLGRWNPKTFVNLANETRATLTSLIPTQVVDIVNQQLWAPQSLRAVFVGGSVLPLSIYQKAISLGWKLVPTYGMTEIASQIATAGIDSWLVGNPELQILNHLVARAEPDGTLSFKSEALFTGYLYSHDGKVVFIDPKVNGWFLSHDVGHIEGPCLKISGRSSDRVKICGEWINLNGLDQLFFDIKQSHRLRGDQTLVAINDLRNGATLYLVSTTQDPQLHLAIKDFNQKVLPIERIQHTYFVDEIPRSTLLKPQKPKLRMEIERMLFNKTKDNQ